MKNIAVIFNQALAALNARDLRKAEEGFRRVIKSEPSHVPALNLLTIVFMSTGRFAEAEPLIARAVKLDQTSDVSFYNYGLIAKQLNKPRVAYEQFSKALKLNPNVRETWNNRGTVSNDLGDHDAALSDFDRAITLDRNYADPYANKGKSLLKVGRHEEALAVYDKALSLRPDLAEAWAGRGTALGSLNRFDEALVAYGRALSLRPDLTEAWIGRGNVLADLKRHGDALAAYDRALSLKSDLEAAWVARGKVLADQRRHDEALACYDKALAIKLDLGQAWIGRGTVLNELGRHQDAFAAFDKAFALDADLLWVEGARLFAKLNCCVWSDLEHDTARLIESVHAGKANAQPFAFLSIDSSPGDQLRCADNWVDNWVDRNVHVAASKPSLVGVGQSEGRPDRIRVGYLSTDFRAHAVGYLAAGLLEAHDHSRFETHAFSIGPNDNSNLRARLEKAFFKFTDLDGRSDDEVVGRIREAGIDILIDLMGHTEGARWGVLARRPAPILVNYLGFAGTVGGGLLDYVIADHTVIPIENQKYFSEKVVYLPHCFMPHDDKGRVLSPVEWDRRGHGLPAEGAVFCAFNNAYKINPATFGSWMRILNRVEHSVLWLSGLQKIARDNLRREAEARGVDPARLVFAERLASPADHLARHGLADLFLDALPYNAHTTASDALWAGLPVLTLIGETFAGRVAASLLNALDMPELIARSREEYEELAIELALDSGKLRSIKEKLAERRRAAPLFDTPLLARHIEAAYEAMYQRSQAGLAPDHIEIPSIR